MTKTTFALLVLLTVSLSRCGIPEAGSSGTISATRVPGPGGRECFAIVQDGRAVGGNCL